MPAKLTRDEFIKNAISVHGHKYSYKKTNYINRRTNVIVTCPTHGDFIILPHNLTVHKLGCPKCRRDYYFNKFIQDAKKIHGNKYNYDSVDYKNSSTKIKIVCPIHGEFFSIPTDHIYNKAGCWECSGRKKLTTEKFINEAKKVHGNLYDYKRVNYKNSSTPVLVGCRRHGFFYTTPIHHIHSKSGCPKCNNSKGELLISNILSTRNIKYVSQKTFNNCKNPKTLAKLKYDFYLPDLNTLIEYNGEQHYFPARIWGQNSATLEEQKHRDDIKKKYARKHGYNFVIIKYSDNIEKKIENLILN